MDEIITTAPKYQGIPEVDYYEEDECLDTDGYYEDQWMRELEDEN